MRINPVLLTLIVISSCTKVQVDETQKKRAEEFTTVVKSNQFVPVAFYSDQPIDYETNDSEIRSETDLWGYVKAHVKDDRNYFEPTGKLTIHQNAVKFPTIDSAIIYRSYKIEPGKDEVFIDFVDYNYIPYRYKLHEYSDTHFIIVTNFHVGNAKLYSRYDKIQ